MPKPPSKSVKTIASASTSAYSPADLLKLARPCIQALKPYVPGRSIDDVRAQYNPERIVKLGSNENPLGTSPRVVKAVTAALTDSSLYPDGASRALRQALATHNRVKPEQVIVGNGSDEILLLIALAYLKPGERVVISENTFSEYEFSGRTLDAEIVKIRLQDYRYDMDAYARALRPVKGARPKMMFICNPNNPTGNYVTHAELEGLLKKTPKSCLVVVDEAYGDYATARDFPRSLALMKKHPNLIVARTFSKLYGLAGLRLGYAIGDAGLLTETLRVKTPFNVNLLVQKAGIAALADTAFVNKSLTTNEKGRAQIEAGLQKLKLFYLPTQANFICFHVPRPAVELCEDLMKRGMIIRPLKSFGLPDWCRVTIGTREQNTFFLRELAEVL